MIINLKVSSNIFERTDTLQRYFADVKRFQILSSEEETKLFQIIKSDCNTDEKRKAKDAIINSNQRFVIAIAKRFATNNNLLDLIAEGNIGLIEAIDSYSMEKETRFISWAVWYIRRAINQYCVNYGTLVRKNNISKTYHTVAQARNRFLQRENRQPTDYELIEILNEEYNLNIKSINDVVDTNIISIDERSMDNDDNREFGDMDMFNSACSSQNMYEEESDNDYLKNTVQNLLKKLKPREKEVICLLFGIGHERAYEIQEVARIMDMSSQRIRQIKVETLLKLKEKIK